GLRCSTSVLLPGFLCECGCFYGDQAPVFLRTAAFFSRTYSGNPSTNGGKASPPMRGVRYLRHLFVMWKPSAVMKSRGIFFSTLATSESLATPIFQRYGRLELLTIVGITLFMPFTASSTAALPTA